MSIEEQGYDYFFTKTRTCNDRSCCWPNDTANDVLDHIQLNKKGRERVPFCFVIAL
ncbi:hypothetical protein GTG28_19745 [Vibrio sp. OCN044]|uniref:Uncharacterized protein n=1 Tax=Vibrio tetraodonis subsp. pristinus TaxID=2695891 RepID=A0A6L8LZ84_9VIBR|nr:hypothetical protein [Vibrio tetraodonis subsp. pristinus]